IEGEAPDFTIVQPVVDARAGGLDAIFVGCPPAIAKHAGLNQRPGARPAAVPGASDGDATAQSWKRVISRLDVGVSGFEVNWSAALRWWLWLPLLACRPLVGIATGLSSANSSQLRVNSRVAAAPA